MRTSELTLSAVLRSVEAPEHLARPQLRPSPAVGDSVVGDDGVTYAIVSATIYRLDLHPFGGPWSELRIAWADPEDLELVGSAGLPRLRTNRWRGRIEHRDGPSTWIPSQIGSVVL